MEQFHQSTPKLLPPTVFERISNDDNSLSNIANTNIGNSTANESSYFSGESQFIQFTNELEKLKEEIKKLHSENENLRHRNKDFVEQAHLYTEVTEHRKISISALEEIIHKQTREIQTLKFDLINEKDSNALKQKDLEAKYNQKVNELICKLNETENKLKEHVKDNEIQIEKIKSENERILNEQNLKIKTLLDEKLNLIESHNKQIDSLKESLNKANSEKELLIEEHNSKTNNLTEENKKYFNELQNLKNYVNNSMPTIQTIKEMTLEREKYEQEILKIKSKNDILQKENSALQIRLKSLNEIMAIQEAQLETSSVQSTNSIQNEKKRVGLLNKWRTKVYELLVQLKSQEINFKQEKNLEQKVVQEYVERLENESTKNKILENIIEDKKAEINVLSNDNTVLNEQVSSLKETNENLEKKCQQDLQSSIELKNFVDSLIKNYQKIEESFKIANKKINHLDQRVEFAKNRLGVIKALYTNRKNEIKRGNILDMTTNLSSIHGSINPNEQISNLNQNQLISLEINNDSENVNLIKNELSKVVAERDLLANKLQNDMQSMNEKLKNMKSEYELIIQTLNNELKELREINELKHQQIEQASQQLTEKGSMYDELNRKYDDLYKKFNELKNELNMDHEKSVRERESQFMEKMSKMNEKLNEARREQAKALVLMRQMERSTNREKERMENLLKSSENYYKEHLKKLQTKVVSLEKEKNILMNSLRQQGSLFNSSATTNLAINTDQVGKNVSLKSPSTNIDDWLEKNSFLSKNFNNLKNKQQDTSEITSFWIDSKQNIEESGDNTNYNENSKISTDNNSLNERSHAHQTSKLKNVYFEYENEKEVDNDNTNNEQDEEDLDNSELNKNNEILQQIRKIMGNLELSDIEDDEDENENENNNNSQNSFKFKNKQNYMENIKSQDDSNESEIRIIKKIHRQNNEDNNVDDEFNEQEFQYEIEHAIDDIFQRKNDSFSD